MDSDGAPTAQARPDAKPAAGSGPWRRRLIWLGGVGALVVVGLQLVPVQGVGLNPPARFAIEAPPEVLAILRESCLDCHSNETRWPFYARLAPGSWLVARDVKEGRSHLNLSDWGGVDEEERALDKENMWDEVAEGEMPPWWYLPAHPGAHLSTAEKATLRAWLMPPKGTGR